MQPSPASDAGVQYACQHAGQVALPGHESLQRQDAKDEPAVQHQHDYGNDYRHGPINILVDPTILLVSAITSLCGTTALYLAFLAPASYHAWLRGSAATS